MLFGFVFFNLSRLQKIRRAGAKGLDIEVLSRELKKQLTAFDVRYTRDNGSAKDTILESEAKNCISTVGRLWGAMHFYDIVLLPLPVWICIHSHLRTLIIHTEMHSRVVL